MQLFRTFSRALRLSRHVCVSLSVWTRRTLEVSHIFNTSSRRPLPVPWDRKTFTRIRICCTAQCRLMVRCTSFASSTSPPSPTSFAFALSGSAILIRTPCLLVCTGTSRVILLALFFSAAFPAIQPATHQCPSTWISFILSIARQGEPEFNERATQHAAGASWRAK